MLFRVILCNDDSIWHYSGIIIIIIIIFMTEILKVVSAVNTLVLFFCPCCANFYRTQVSLGSGLWVPVSLSNYIQHLWLRLC